MRLIPTFTALLVPLGPWILVSANTAPEPGTFPDSTPTKTTQQATVRETTPNLLGVLFDIANTLDLRACVPGALPLITALPKIPAVLLKQDAIKQVLSQSTRDLEHVCDFSVTGPVGDTFTSFLPTWYSWYHRYSARVASIVSKCPQVGALISTVEAYETCRQVIAQISSASATPTGTEGKGSDSMAISGTSNPSETAPTDAPSATDETGFLGTAAAVAAGVLGLIAAL
ncbi:hypothetical protein GGS21DRAFT_536002 [Xylaria nigripes]|nr:hypothetical protein GGS21DRAFT_536002 [Xylaria nigripes]